MAQVTFPNSSGGGGGGGAVTIGDGNDVNSGATTDVAIVSDANGTLSGKIRGLVKMLADVWDSANHWLQVKVMNTVTVSDGGGSLTVDGTVSVNEPVSIDDNGGSITVDGSVTVSGTVAVSNPSFPTTPTVWANATYTTAPAAGAVIVDTGQLAAGNYWFKVFVGVAETEEMNIEHRNAANSGNQAQWVLDCTANVRFGMVEFCATIQTNERIRVINVNAGGAGIHFSASIMGGTF